MSRSGEDDACSLHSEIIPGLGVFSGDHSVYLSLSRLISLLRASTGGPFCYFSAQLDVGEYESSLGLENL